MDRRRNRKLFADWKLRVRRGARSDDNDSSPSCSSCPSPSPLPAGMAFMACSPGHCPFYSKQNSFRVDGNMDGEVDMLCRSLGLSGPEDFGISSDAWKAMKSQPSAKPCPQQQEQDYGRPRSERASAAVARTCGKDGTKVVVVCDKGCNNDYSEEYFGISTSELRADACNGNVFVEDAFELSRFKGNVDSMLTENHHGHISSEIFSRKNESTDAGIKGVRPSPVLITPPAVSMLPCPPSTNTSVKIADVGCSMWDIIRSYAPDGGGSYYGGNVKTFDSEEDEENMRMVSGELRLGEISEGFTATSSLSTFNDDDASSTTTEGTFIISPNAVFKRKIRSWRRGRFLGSGSFGSVYEAFSDEGIFFAVKEVSLSNVGKDAEQCIFQLEQEIMLLSQFEHENIVKYYGADKESSKLLIFLELVTQGSLESLYQKYPLQNSIVVSYTRQIINGLVYLHDRNIVHRDIKCANILVHANGSIKLADFGLAKEITKFCPPKSCKGSIYWMAPEVAKPVRAYGPSADIWSLGCTVLEMLTRQVPYPNLEFQQAFFKIIEGEPPSVPSSLSRKARDFINQCLRVNPDERPSARQLLEHPFLRHSPRTPPCA